MSIFTLSSLDEVLASIPAALGFVPAESFIVAATVHQPGGAKVLGAIGRIHVTALTADTATTALRMSRMLADLASSDEIADLLAVVTTDTVTSPEDFPSRAAVDDVSAFLAERGFSGLVTLFLPAFVAGARWRSYHDAAHTGFLPDPATTPATVAEVLAGRSVASSRDELARRFTPGSDDDRTRLRTRVARAASLAHRDDATQRLALLRGRLARVDRAVRDARAGRFPRHDLVIADLISSLTIPRLRDATLGALSPEDAQALEDLALHLWKLAEEPYASHLATIVAVRAYRRGSGATARIATTMASRSCELAQLIGVALDNDVAPSRITSVIDASCREIRTSLGLSGSAEDSAAQR